MRVAAEPATAPRLSPAALVSPASPPARDGALAPATIPELEPASPAAVIVPPEVQEEARHLPSRWGDDPTDGG
jgi:hypothetical protein